MLLAPFALVEPGSTKRPRRPRSRPSPVERVPAWLFAWAAAGALAVLLVPALRGSDFGGATLPFWLVAAPLIDIAWLTRARWAGAWRGRRIDR